MPVIRNIAIHHSGGSASNPFASSAYLTFKNIDDAHRVRWNFKSTRGFYAGYNAVYDPKDRTITFARALGEETAAQFGYNFDTFSICIIGNFSIDPRSWPRQPVDLLTPEIKNDITRFLHGLIEGNTVGFPTIGGTTLDLSVTRVHPHRFYGNTECYGTFVPDNLFRDLLIATKPSLSLTVPALELTPTLTERGAIEKKLLELWSMVADLQKKIELFRNPKLGRADGGRACSGFIE
jgi:hypothetical protein